MLPTTVTQVSITEDAPVQAPPEHRAETPSALSWWWLVGACALVLLLVAGTLAVWWARTLETRTTSYRVLGDLTALRLDLGDADLELDGGGTAVEVRRVERFAFGRPSVERKTPEAGRLTLASRCPDQILGGCRTTYFVTVPDNVPVEVATTSGDVSLTGVRASVRIGTDSGAVSATNFCGFALRANSDTGDVSAVSECSAERLELRSGEGDVRAVVPAGRYEIDAQSDSGAVRIRGLTDVESGAFQIQALSTSGDVTVEAAS
jgi:hypothetical protein